MSNTNPKMMTLICQHDGHEWQRASQRGRPPKFCPEHTAVGADNKTGQAKLPQRPSSKPVVKAGEDISPVALEKRMNGHSENGAENGGKKKRELTPEHKAALAEGRERKARERAEAEAQRHREAIERMEASLPGLYERYDTAWEIANRDNTREAWNKADAAQMAILNTRAAIRKGVAV